jgi:hypothetical protein
VTNDYLLLTLQFIGLNTTISARYKASFCGRSRAELWARIPPGALMFVSVVCCQVEVYSRG